jgi:acetamidase/formamidase
MTEAALFPLGETPEAWIPIGLDLDLREAMKACMRNALLLLEIRRGVDRPTALAYLSAAVDFSVSQVVDVVTGVHAAIRTADLRGL